MIGLNVFFFLFLICPKENSVTVYVIMVILYNFKIKSKTNKHKCLDIIMMI